MAERKKATRYRIRCCAFCGMTEYQVTVLIEGPAIGFTSQVNICGDCVEVCAGIVLKDRERRESLSKVSGGNQGATAERAVTPSASEAK